MAVGIFRRLTRQERPCLPALCSTLDEEDNVLVALAGSAIFTRHCGHRQCVHQLGTEKPEDGSEAVHGRVDLAGLVASALIRIDSLLIAVFTGALVLLTRPSASYLIFAELAVQTTDASIAFCFFIFVSQAKVRYHGKPHHPRSTYHHLRTHKDVGPSRPAIWRARSRECVCKCLGALFCEPRSTWRRSSQTDIVFLQL